jgi:hypothetical protein
MKVHYDEFADVYYTRLPNGKELWCDCPVMLDDILHRLDERETRREDARGTWVAIMLAAGLLAVAAVVAMLAGG